MRRLTPRSSGAPTAGHQARSGGTRYIFASPGLASCRRRPLSSNVRPHIQRPSCTKRSLILSSFFTLLSSCSSSAGWSLYCSATQGAGSGSTQLGSGLRTSRPSLWLRFKLGLAWSVLSQHLNRGFVFKVVHPATRRASSNTGFKEFSFLRLQPGPSHCCTPSLQPRLQQLGGVTRPRGLHALPLLGVPAQLPWRSRQNQPVPQLPVKPNPSLKRSANGSARRSSSAGPAAHFALAAQRALPLSPA